MEGQVVLKTTVPVYVTVDLEDRMVTEVHVDDEAPMTYSEEATIEHGPSATPEQRQAAIELAEGGTEWPAWEFGW